MIVRAIIVCSLLTACSVKPPFQVKIGAGYKLDESDMYGYSSVTPHDSSALSARLELFQEIDEWSYGVSHHSQWLTGVPFDNEWEYSKTEVFVDYTFTLN